LTNAYTPNVLENELEIHQRDLINILPCFTKSYTFLAESQTDPKQLMGQQEPQNKKPGVLFIQQSSASVPLDANLQISAQIIALHSQNQPNYDPLFV
jgi:hypothetical protein